MKIIYKPRQAGKTTELIKIASDGRYKLIVCCHQDAVDMVWRLAHQLKEEGVIKNLPPMPITMAQFLEGRFAYGRNIESFLIDDVEHYFWRFSRGVPVEAMSITKDEEGANPSQTKKVK